MSNTDAEYREFSKNLLKKFDYLNKDLNSDNTENDVIWISDIQDRLKRIERKLLLLPEVIITMTISIIMSNYYDSVYMTGGIIVLLGLLLLGFNILLLNRTKKFNLLK